MKKGISSYSHYSAENKKYVKKLDAIVEQYVAYNSIDKELVNDLWQQLSDIPVAELVIERVLLFWNRVAYFNDKQVMAYFCEQYECFLGRNTQAISSDSLDSAMRQLTQFKLMV
jgi:hypothetical protein